MVKMVNQVKTVQTVPLVLMAKQAQTEPKVKQVLMALTEQLVQLVLQDNKEALDQPVLPDQLVNRVNLDQQVKKATPVQPVPLVLLDPAPTYLTSH
jgi:hypothetical protein